MKDQKEPSNIKQKYHYNGRVFKKTRGGAPFFGATRHIYVSSNEKKSNKQLEDLPDEVIQNVLNFLELPDLIRCGLVSKRIRSVSFIESLWQKIDISDPNHVFLNRQWKRKIVPTDLLKRIINRGCKSLSLTGKVII